MTSMFKYIWEARCHYIFGNCCDGARFLALLQTHPYVQHRHAGEPLAKERLQKRRGSFEHLVNIGHTGHFPLRSVSALNDATQNNILQMSAAMDTSHFQTSRLYPWIPFRMTLLKGVFELHLGRWRELCDRDHAVSVRVSLNAQ